MPKGNQVKTNNKTQCNKCKAQVTNTVGAMQQHNQAKHARGKRQSSNAGGGAYVALKTNTTKPGPKMTSRGGVMRVTNSEAITLSFADAATASTTIPISSGPGGKLPWLANLALNYEKIHYNSVTVDFLPLLATDRGGDVIAYFDPNSTDPAPTTYEEAYSAGRAKTARLWDKGHLTLTSADLHAQKEYSADGVTSGNLFGTPGNIQIFSTRSEGTDAEDYGRAIVTYDVSLLKPERPDTGSMMKIVGPRSDFWTVVGATAFDGSIKYPYPSQTAITNLLVTAITNNAASQPTEQNYTKSFGSVYGSSSNAALNWTNTLLTGEIGDLSDFLAGNLKSADGTTPAAAPTSQILTMLKALAASYA